MPRYRVEWSELAKTELKQIRSFYRPAIVTAVDELAAQAETETRNRKRLRATVEISSKYPDPTWEIRVGLFRVVYGVEGETVRILGVKIKGARTIGEIL